MKKGLLTVLLASLVLVGCQNYDDQFDDLNAQISALKSQVDGLSALSGQVSALSTSISGLQSGIAASASSAQMTSLSASLTALQAEVDAIEAAIATTATAAEVTALQTSLTALETDLADLLTSNNVYATAITVNSAASMASALALGNKVALMNASVTITDDATISDTDIQTFVNRIKTMNGTLTYSSGSATGFTPTFDEMVAATALALTPAGPVSFKKLASATTVTITTTYSTKITSLDMSALASVTSFNTGTVHQLHLSSATNVDLGALPRYGTALSIQTKKGATLDIASLDDVGTTGLIAPMTLTLNGPASVSLSKISDGTIALSNIGSATVSGFYGILDINAGVETLTTTDSVFIELDGAADLVTATLDYKYDWDPALTSANAAISAAGYSTTYLEDYSAAGSIIAADLKTLTVTGDLLDLHLNEANIETLSINANMTDLTMDTMTDLTSLTVAGGKIGSITLKDSPNITVANFDHTSNMENKDSATANKSVNFTVTDNLGLTKLHTTGDLVHNFTVTGNDALTELDMTGLKTRGTETTGGTVYLYDNDLTAVKSTDTTDAETATATTGADGGSADVGTTDDGTSGMDTMKIYLTAIAADATNVAQVNFDTVSTFDDSETATTATTLNVLGTTTVAAANDATVLKMTAAGTDNSTATKGATKQKRAFAFDYSASDGVQMTVNGVKLFDTALAGAGTDLTISTSNKDLQIQAIESAVNVARAAAANVTLDAKRGHNSSGTISFIQWPSAGSTATNYGERYSSSNAAGAAVSATNYGTGLDDLFTVTVGGQSVTYSLTGGGQTVTTLTAMGAALVNAWGAKYGGTGTASLSALATMTNASGVVTIDMLQEDSAGYDKLIEVSVSAGTTGTLYSATSMANVDWNINGDLGDDNKTNDSDIIVTIESTVAGVTENTISTLVTDLASSAAGKATWIELTTDYTVNTTYTETYAKRVQPRTDVAQAEDTVAGTANTAAAATNFNRVTWLG